MAMEYAATLKYQLSNEDWDMEALVERLGEAGCDDALVGIGQLGRLALEFTREADSADAAVRSALADDSVGYHDSFLRSWKPWLSDRGHAAAILA